MQGAFFLILIGPLCLGALQTWRLQRMRLTEQAALISPSAAARVCERIIVFTKRDLVPEWGIEVRPRLCALRGRSFTMATDVDDHHSRFVEQWPLSFPNRQFFLRRGTNSVIFGH